MGGHLAVVRVLLNKGEDVNAKTAEGLTALKIATQESNQEMSRLLKQAGAKE